MRGWTDEWREGRSAAASRCTLGGESGGTEALTCHPYEPVSGGAVELQLPGPNVQGLHTHARAGACTHTIIHNTHTHTCAVYGLLGSA